VGIAYLRIDMLPSARQEPLRDSFRRYLDARLSFYRKLMDTSTAEPEASRATALQREIWSQAIAECREAALVRDTFVGPIIVEHDDRYHNYS
jgi:hypothetical protein